MPVWSPLTTNWAVTSDSSPRPGPIDSIGHHHAASTSLSATLQLFQPGGREVSPNYCIYRDQIWGVVPEDRRAWTSSSAPDDGRSITYEIINSSGGPDWSFDPVTLDTVKRLDADIMRRYGVRAVHAMPGFWEHSDLYVWFGRSYPTACAGPSFHINEIIAGAAAYAAGVPAEQQEDTEMFTAFWKQFTLVFGQEYLRVQTDWEQALAARDVLGGKFYKLSDPQFTGVMNSMNVPWYAFDACQKGQAFSSDGSTKGNTWSRQLEIANSVKAIQGSVALFDPTKFASTVDEAIADAVKNNPIGLNVDQLAKAVNDEAARRLKE